MTLEELEREAEKLGPEERLPLAERLVRGFHANPDPEIQQAWLGESERRLDSYLAGKAKGVSADSVFARIERERDEERSSASSG